jgi:hypothetical protein
MSRELQSLTYDIWLVIQFHPIHYQALSQLPILLKVNTIAQIVCVSPAITMARYVLGELTVSFGMELQNRRGMFLPGNNYPSRLTQSV